jgi:hypothetical protein
MPKQMRALPIILSIVLIATAAQAATAPKAGSVCKKAGQTVTAAGKKFTCVKSGKKLIWNKGVATTAPKPIPVATGVPEPTPIPTPTPTPVKTPEPKPLVAGDPCNTVGEAINNAQGYLECRDVANNQKKYFQLSNSIADLPAQTSPLPFTTCRVPDFRTNVNKWDLATAYPINWSTLRREGVNKVLFIPFDFSDHPGTKSPAETIGSNIRQFEDWAKWYTNGKLKFEVQTTNQWVRASKPSLAYNDNLGHANPNNYLAFEMLLKDSENLFDYTNADVVFLFFPSDLKTFKRESGSHGVTVRTNKGPIRMGLYAVGASLINNRTDLWYWLVHELLHAWGIKSHAPGWPNVLSVNTGSAGPGQSLTIWDSMTLDWSKPEDLWCAELESLKTSEVTLSPLEREQKGVKAAMIKLAPSRVLVIESHRKDKWGKFIPGTYGVTAYIVDTRFDTDRSGEYLGLDDFRGIKYTKAANYLEFKFNHGTYFAERFNPDNGESWGIVPFFSKNYFLYEDESFTFEGVTVKLIKSGDNDTIQISKG